MKMYNCKGCGKIITEEEIGFRDEDGNVFCKACALKLTVEEKAEETPEEKPAVKEKKLKGLHIFLIVAGVLLIAEIGLYLFNGMRPVESISIEEVVAKCQMFQEKFFSLMQGCRPTYQSTPHHLKTYQHFSLIM